MATYITGTADVDADGVTVTWTGDALTAANCAAGFPVVVDGQASFVASRTNTTTLVLATAVTPGSGLAAAISNLTSREISNAELNRRTSELLEQLSVLDANGRGLFYNLLGVTGQNDPGPTYLALNGSLASPSTISELYLDVIDANGFDVAGVIDLWTVGTVLTVRSVGTSAYVSLRLTVVPTNEGPDAWRRILALTHVSSDGLLVAGEAVAVEWNRPGPNADLGNPQGAYSALTTYTYRDIVTDQGATWLYHNAVDGAGNAPPALPTETNSHWQLVGAVPTVQDVLDQLGLNHVTISTADPSGGVENDLWFKVPV